MNAILEPVMVVIEEVIRLMTDAVVGIGAANAMMKKK